LLLDKPNLAENLALAGVPRPAAAAHLALTLLVAGILADHPDHAQTADNLAIFAFSFDRRTYFHLGNSQNPGQSRRLQ